MFATTRTVVKYNGNNGKKMQAWQHKFENQMQDAELMFDGEDFEGAHKAFSRAFLLIPEPKEVLFHLGDVKQARVEWTTACLNGGPELFEGETDCQEELATIAEEITKLLHLDS